MGTPKQSSSDRQSQGYQMAMSGQDPSFLGGRTDTNLAQGFWRGYNDLQAQQAQQMLLMEMFAGMFEGAGHAPAGPSYESQMAQQQAEYERRLEEQRRAEGIAKRDEMYGNYMTAAGSATDYVNSQIAKEQSNAALLGIDYKIDDEIKNQRISNYFATIWGEGDQAQLEQSMSEWGNPQGFTDWIVTRGDGSAFQAPGGEETLVGTTKGKKVLGASLVDDDELLGV